MTDFWRPKEEVGILWNDPDIAIEWPLEIGQQPIISDRDKNYKPFKSLNRYRR